ncbi:MAG: hypothetical protein F6K62_04030 [Sphaerospermopsis sp. SIO1G2]|nr:hypothetical protein [Sphaerospermopsis sp. SIO1G2]
MLASKSDLWRLENSDRAFWCHEVYYWQAVRLTPHKMPTPKEFHNYNWYLIATKSAVTGNRENLQELGRKECLPKVQVFQVLILKYFATFQLRETENKFLILSLHPAPCPLHPASDTMHPASEPPRQDFFSIP